MDEGGDDAGIVVVFEGVDAGFDVGGGVGGIYRHGGLEYDGAFVAVLADVVDGDACLGIAGGYDGFMDMAAIHAFASVARKKRGMDVDYAAFETVYEKRWYHEKESGKYYHVDGVPVHETHDVTGIIELTSVKDLYGYAEAGGALDNSRVGAVGDNECYFGRAIRSGVEVAYDGFGIGSTAGGEYCYFGFMGMRFHGVKLAIISGTANSEDLRQCYSEGGA